jgi:hypothetical protein
VEVQRHLSWRHARAVRHPHTLGLDGCAGLVLDLKSAGAHPSAAHATHLLLRRGLG